MRKRSVQLNPDRNVWFGLGMMGLVGWSIVIPTILGAALGIYVDDHNHGKYSWTLMFMLFGLILGSVNAWHWVIQQQEEMRKDIADDSK